MQLTSSKQGAATDTELVDDLLFHRTPPSRLLSALPLINQWDVIHRLKRRVHEIVKNDRPDVVHVHSPALNGVAVLNAVRPLGIPVVYEIRALWEDAAVDQGKCREGDLRYRLTRALEQFVVNRVDQVVCICEGLRGELARRGVSEQKLSIVPNGVNLEEFGQPSLRDPDLSDRLGLFEGKTIGFIGSFFDFEGVDLIVEAMDEIVAHDPQVKLLLVGGGECEESLRHQVSRSAVAKNIAFTGRVPHSEVHRYYDLVDIFVYARKSKRITELVTPLKPLEAMARDRLVIASDVGGHRELIRDGSTGWLFRAGDTDALVDTCLKVMNSGNRWREVKRAAREFVETQRNWQLNVQRYAPIYQRALG